MTEPYTIEHGYTHASEIFKGQGKYCLTTYGCQMNAHDSEILAGLLQEMGYVPTAEEKDADIILYNTCCIRETAERRVFGNVSWLRMLKKERPESKVVVFGCMMQQKGMAERMRKTYDFVDIIFGTYAMARFPYMLRDCFASGEFIAETEETMAISEGLPQRRKTPFHAYVNIMYGCNNYCTYCIVPYVRGRERSRSLQSILEEVRRLKDEGVQELMLLGQNVNSYGKDLPGEGDFSALLREVDAIGIPRVRFMTSHPKDVGRELLEVMASSRHIAKQLHLPVQSGSGRILEKMNRKYTVESYLEVVETARELMPDIGLTTDMIVGFPGETEEDFAASLRLMERVRYDSAFTFIFSPREGTPAAKMEGQVEQKVKSLRISALIEAQAKITAEINESLVGSSARVLVDNVNDEGIASGKTERGNHLHLSGQEEDLGKILNVRIASCQKGTRLMAERIEK